MPNFVSPGIYVLEKDISEYAPTVNSSVVGIVGFATKGKTNTATLITSPENLVNTFGRPSENITGQGLEGALEVLETTNQVYFLRAAVDASANDASAQVPLGSCAAMEVSNVSGGVTGSGSLYFKISVKNNTGTEQYTVTNPKSFAVPVGTVPAAMGASGQATALKKIIGGALDSDKVGVTVASNGTAHFIVGSFAGSGASISVSAYNEPTYTTGTYVLLATSGDGLVAGAGAVTSLASSLTIYGSTFYNKVASGIGYLAETIHPGTGYNLSTLADGSVRGNSVEVENLGGANTLITVNDEGVAKETFKTSFLDGNGTYIEDVINTGETNLTSDIIKGNLVSGAGSSDFTNTKLTAFDSYLSSMGVIDLSGTQGGDGLAISVDGARFIKPVEGSVSLAGGTDGTGSDSENNTALVGLANLDPKTGMQALDDDALNISVAMVPGVYDQTVQDNLVTLAESTQNFLALVSPPEGVGTAQDAIDWSNGGSESRTASLNSSYAAIYWPHVKVFSVFDGKDRFYDPAIFAARQMAFTDNSAETWFAPAGFVRGKLSKPSEVEVKLNQGDRDSMYSGGNVINPIVNFPQQGITIFGQRTSQRDASALDRVNIRRMMILIRKQILASTTAFVFEPNDPITWQRIETLINPMMDDIKQRRGITEFRVVCDETTNTSVRIDRNELWCKVLIKPTKTAEILIFEINLTNQSAKLG